MEHLAMKYIDAEKLKGFVRELKERAKRNSCDTWGIVPDALEEVENFIDSLQQEQPEVDLEIERIVKDEEKFMNFQARHQLIGYVARHFAQWGAEHAREQMMSEAVEGEVVSTSDNGWECIRIYKKLHKCDDKVKLIIVKED